MTHHTKKSGLTRLINAFVNSGKGFRYAIKNEQAFQQELLLCGVLTAVTFFLNITLPQQLILIAALVFVLIAEVVNSAIEATIDRIGTEIHPLSGTAKDLGSLAVMLAFALATLIWAAVLL